jgi:rubrerythrin
MIDSKKKERGAPMTGFASVDDIIDFAIRNEEEAYAFYMDLAERIPEGPMRKVLIGFAKEEEGHRTKLLNVKKGKVLIGGQRTVQDLKIGDYLIAPRPEGDLDYQGALILAMKREKAAFKLYMDLSDIVSDDHLADMFLNLAKEEAKHKLRFEIEYDEHILKWN